MVERDVPLVKVCLPIAYRRVIRLPPLSSFAVTDSYGDVHVGPPAVDIVRIAVLLASAFREVEIAV